MFVPPFFDALRSAGIPVSLREYLTFLEGMSSGLVTYDIDGFYYLARTAMVKDERNLDKFDRAFAAAFKGIEQISLSDVLEAVDIPGDWLEKKWPRSISARKRWTKSNRSAGLTR